MVKDFKMNWAAADLKDHLNTWQALMPCGHAVRYSQEWFPGNEIPTNNRFCLICQRNTMTEAFQDLEYRASNHIWALQHPDYAKTFPNTLAFLNRAISLARQILYGGEE